MDVPINRSNHFSFRKITTFFQEDVIKVDDLASSRVITISDVVKRIIYSNIRIIQKGLRVVVIVVNYQLMAFIKLENEKESFAYTTYQILGITAELDFLPYSLKGRATVRGTLICIKDPNCTKHFYQQIIIELEISFQNGIIIYNLTTLRLSTVDTGLFITRFLIWLWSILIITIFIIFLVYS